jgi:hypothetical protein
LREPPPEDDAPQPEPLPPPLTGDELARQTPTGPQAGSLDDSRYSD